MLAIMLLLIAGGIGLAQAVSDPKQVTLRWLRLGGIIAVTLIAIAWFVPMPSTALPDIDQRYRALRLVIGLAALLAVGQLMLVQLGKMRLQQWASLIVTAVCVTAATYHVAALILEEPHRAGIQALAAGLFGAWAIVCVGTFVSMTAAAGLTGGFLMTMLLGHAYLTAGSEMTQKPFARLVKVLAGLLVLRAAVSLVCGLWPYWSLDVPRSQQMWNTMMITARYGVGLLVPAVFTYMIWDCVKRRSNQSATGILYVATVLVMIGEGIALGLIDATGVVF